MVDFVPRSHHTSLQDDGRQPQLKFPQAVVLIGSSVEFDEEQSQFGEGGPVERN